MPRNITVTFDDGSSHVYNNAPDDVTPEQIEARAAKDFSGRRVTALDGGRGVAPAPEPAPADAAGNVEDARKLADIASRLRATQDSIPAQPAPPRREVGFVESAGRTAGASAIPVAKMFGLAAATAARLFGRKAQDKVFEAMDRVTGSMEREYRPQAGEEFDTAGQFAGGILSMPVEIAGGYGLQHGVERAQEVVQRGGTVGEAAKAGAVTAVTRVALNALPVKFGGAVGRAVENAVGRVIGGGLTGAGIAGITGTAGRAAENAVLPEGEQFSDLRQNVAPSVAELGLGAAFGAVPGALAAARTLLGAAEIPVRDLPRKVPEAEKLFPDGVATAIVKPNPVKLAEAAAVERAGGTVNVHNVTERPALREIGRAAQHVPFGGGKTEQNRRAITEATVKLLDPDAKDKQLSTEAFNRINDKNGSTIRENMSSVGDVRIDENVSSQLMDLSKRAVDIIDRDQRAYVMKRIADTLDAAEARGGTLSGSELAKWDSAIGEKIRDHHDNSDLTRPLRELQEIVRDAAEKHMPPGKVKETQVARRRYAYGMTLLPDIKKFGATGYIEPGQLWDLVNRDDLGKRRTMSGGSELTDLAKAAKMIEEPEGHGRLTVGTKLGIGTGAGAVAYLNPAAAGAAATAAVGGSRIYNRVGPALVRRLAKEYDKRQARAAQTPEPPPLELAAPDAPTPQGPRPDVRGEAPAEVPEWTTTAGVDAQKPGSQIPAIEPEGLLPAVGDDMPPARINPEPRSRVPDIPAVPGRPDMPDVMVAGGPREVAATETTGRAMQAPEAALAREQQGYAPKKPEPPAGGGGGGGTPPTDPRLAKIAELRRQAPSQAVKKVLDAREAEIKKVIKRETDIAELEAAARATDDVDLRQSLLAEANKLRGGKLPVGEVTEGMPDLPKPKTEKIPVGKVIEGQPDLPVGKTEKIPVGEATEITPEVVEPAPERIPVGEATEMPEPLPVGKVVEDPIPVGDAMEFEQMPVGEATEITPEVVEPKAAATESRKDKAEASFKRRYGEGYKAAAEERRALEEEIVNSFPTYQAGGEVVTPVIEAVERAWGRRRITMNPEGFERAVVEALRPVAERRKEWKTREKARDNDRRIKNQLAAYEKSVRDAQHDAMGELRTLERQGRLSQDEIEDLNRRIQKSETMDDAVDEMDAIIMKKNQSSGTSVVRSEPAANEPAGKAQPDVVRAPDGAPMVLYRAGSAAGAPVRGKVPYFTPRRADAADYAKVRKEEGYGNKDTQIREAHLALRNPAKDADIRRVAEENGIDLLHPDYPAAYLDSSPELVAALKEAGYDGAVGLDGRPSDGKEIMSYAVFSPEQVRDVPKKPTPVVPEATNVDNAPTAPAGGGRSEGMEQTKGGYAAEKEAWEKVKARSAAAADALKKYPKGPNGMTPDAVKKTEAWRRDYAEYEQAFANERKWNASMLRKYGAEIRAERQAAREAKVQPAPAPQAPAGGGAGMEPTKSIPEPYGSLGYKRLQYFSDGKPAEGYSRFDFGDPVVVRENGAKGTVDGILGMTPGGEPTHFVVQTDLGRVKVSTHAIDPAQENTRAPQAPAGGAQPKITHAGMEIEEIPGKGGEPTRWQVTIPETGDRVQTPSGLDAAKRMAENERKMIERHGTTPEREKAAEVARAAEEQARADTKKTRSAETAGKSLAEIKAMDHMNRTIRVDGKDMKAHEFVDARLAAGDVPKVEMVDRVAPMSRRAFNNASNAEQRAHEAKVKAAGKKESYWLGGYGLSKTEYDYAVKKDTARAPQAPAGGGPVKGVPTPGDATRVTVPPLVRAMVGAATASAAALRDRVSQVRWAPTDVANNGITFLFDGKPMVAELRGRNADAVLRGKDAESDRALAVRTMLDGDMKTEPTKATPEPVKPAAVEPDPLALTPKQYHEAKLRSMADENGVSMPEVREMYDTEAGRANNTQEWVQAVMDAAKAGKPITRATLDKLEEVRPRAVGQLMHDYPYAKLPEGYQVPGARKAETEEAAARRANRAAAKADARAPKATPEPVEPAAPKPAGKALALSDNRKMTLGALQRAGYIVQDLDSGMKVQTRGELRVTLKAIPHDIDVVIGLKDGNWKVSEVSSEAPTSVSQTEAVTEFRKQVESSLTTKRPVQTPPILAPKPAPSFEVPVFKSISEAMTSAEVKAEFQRQIDAVPRFGDGGPETITLKAGGSSARIQNTARRVAEYMKDLDKVKGGKTPKPVPKMTHDRPSGRAWWGTDLGRRAPLKTIADMIDDFDSQAAVDFAAAQGIDLEEALKGDRKRLDRVRGLKPTPDLNEGM